MSLINEALRAAHAPVARTGMAPPRIALVAGAGGSLGSAVLEQALATGGFRQVQALVAAPVAPALAAFQPVYLEALEQHRPVADTAFIVFDRERYVNGRDDAFVRPLPEHLPQLATRLHAAGVRRLLVVMPHAVATLPQALQRGLASLDEQAVAALGFEHILFVRSPQAPPAVGSASSLQRVAHWVLGQLQLMVPQREQPVRAVKLGSFAVQLARQLPLSDAGTRVVPPEVVWQASQGDEAEVARAWLQREALPEAGAARVRY